MKIKSLTAEELLEEVSSSASISKSGAMAAVIGAFSAALLGMVGDNCLKMKKNKEKFQQLVLKAASFRQELLRLGEESYSLYQKAFAEREDKRILRQATLVSSEIFKKTVGVLKIAKFFLKFSDKKFLADVRLAIFLAEAAKKRLKEIITANLGKINDFNFSELVEEELKVENNIEDGS